MFKTIHYNYDFNFNYQNIVEFIEINMHFIYIGKI